MAQVNELDLLEQVIKEWREEIADPDEPGHVPTFLESLRVFRENLVELDLADATAGRGEDPFKLQYAEQALAIVDQWLGTAVKPIEVKFGLYTVIHDTVQDDIVVTYPARRNHVEGEIVRAVEAKYEGGWVRISRPKLDQF